MIVNKEVENDTLSIDTKEKNIMLMKYTCIPLYMHA